MVESQSILSASAIPTTRDSRVRVSFWNPLGTARVVVLRTLTQDENGRLIPSADEITVAAATTTQTNTVRLTSGRLISAAISCPSTQLNRGTLFCRIELQSGSVSDLTSRLFLAAGYISTGKSVAYPLTNDDDPMSGLVVPVLLSPVDPGAGTDIGFTFDSNVYLKLIGGTFDLETAATVGSRLVTLQIGADGEVFAEVVARTAQIISQIRRYNLWSGPNIPADTTTNFYLPLPTADIMSQVSLGTSTANLAAGDVFSNAQFFYTPYIRT